MSTALVVNLRSVQGDDLCGKRAPGALATSYSTSAFSQATDSAAGDDEFDPLTTRKSPYSTLVKSVTAVDSGVLSVRKKCVRRVAKRFDHSDNMVSMEDQQPLTNQSGVTTFGESSILGNVALPQEGFSKGTCMQRSSSAEQSSQVPPVKQQRTLSMLHGRGSGMMSVCDDRVARPPPSGVARASRALPPRSKPVVRCNNCGQKRGNCSDACRQRDAPGVVSSEQQQQERPSMFDIWDLLCHRAGEPMSNAAAASIAVFPRDEPFSMHPPSAAAART